MITLQQLKNLVITPELQNAVSDYLMAVAQEETIKGIVLAYQSEWLAKNAQESTAWMTDIGFTLPKDQRTDPSNSFLLNDEKSKEYHSYCFVNAVQKGFDGQCPYSLAKGVRIRAKRQVIVLSEYITSISYDDLPFDLHGKLLDIIIPMVTKKCDMSVETVMANY